MHVPKENSRKLLKSVGGEVTGVILATDVVRIRAFRDFLSEDEVRRPEFIANIPVTILVSVFIALPPSPFKSSIDTSSCARALRKHLHGIASTTNVQLVHLVLECCSFQSEALCRPAPAGYPARRAFQRIDNDLTFSLFEC